MPWCVGQRLFQAIALATIAVSTACTSADSSAMTEESPVLAMVPPAASALPSATPIPGTDAAIQRWFLSNDALKVRFNDALLRAQRGVAAGDAAECKPLDTAARAQLAALPALQRLPLAGQELAATIQAPVTTFAAAATACLAKDFAAAQVALDAGVVQQADAQAAVDEILEGEY
jgi:hypothetical protein